jgi:hypothetical protein
MGNNLAFCCKQNDKVEGQEINRMNFQEYKRHERYEETIDKSKGERVLSNEAPAEYIQNKSQEIFENRQFNSMLPVSGQTNNPEIDNEPIENPQEYQERYTSLYQSYHAKDDEFHDHKPAPKGIEIDNIFLKEFYVNHINPDDVNLDQYLNSKVLQIKKKNANLKEDLYFNKQFDDKIHDDKVNLNIAPVYIDKVRRNEIYYGSWNLLKNAEISHSIQNLKSIMKFNGYGVYIKEDKSIIEGIFHEGELDGPGRVIVANGDLFKGIYQNGFLNNKGIFIDFAGNIYEGDFKLNIMEGFGKETFVDGSSFEGEYKRNKKNGKGKFVWNDGSYYHGELQDNNLHGKGIYSWASGLKYEGDWSKGAMHGSGVITTPNGDYYEGGFKDNKKDGFGLFWWNERKYYLGFWQDGLQHGNGKFFKEGKLMIGSWNKGKFEKHLEKEQIKFPDFKFNKRVSF